MEQGNICWQSAKFSLYCKANDDEFNFDNRNLDANDNYSGGVSVLGKCLLKKMSLLILRRRVFLIK